MSTDWNEELPTKYLTVFDYWAESVMAERAGSSNPPKPPNAFVEGFFTDSTNPPARWAFPAANTLPEWMMRGGPLSIKPTPFDVEYSYARVS